MRILLLSAYDAVSHRYWRQGLVNALPEHDWTTLALPPRYFAWRVRGNSLSWAFSARDTLLQHYDLVIATSMVDLTGLRGLVPELAAIPTLVYFHENQFAYPTSGREFNSVEPQMLNLYNALAADHVLFNSEFNRCTLLEGAERLLRKLPDQVPSGLTEHIDAHAQVVPVPLPDEVFLPATPRTGPLQLVWNHRWEFDKGPELLLASIQAMQQRGIDFRLHLVGQQFRHTPEVFDRIHQQLQQGNHLGQWGHVESVAEYRRLLQQADVVLSTALHDYQGIAVLEGVAAGCTPLVPDRLAYRELFASAYRYGGEQEADALAAQVEQLAALKAQGRPLPCPDISGLSWVRLKASYSDAISRTLQARQT
jgi:glycosyltransferase involved in cell wall biosynthesis